MLKKASLSLAVCQLMLWPSIGFAQDPVVVGRGQNRVDANAGTVTIMTTRNLASPAMTAALDLSTLLDAGEQYEEMRIIPVVARGKVQNLWDILYLRGVDMGFVQTDILAYLEDDPRIDTIKPKICYITVMPRRRSTSWHARKSGPFRTWRAGKSASTPKGPVRQWSARCCSGAWGSTHVSRTRTPVARSRA